MSDSKKKKEAAYQERLAAERAGIEVQTMAYLFGAETQLIGVVHINMGPHRGDPDVKVAVSRALRDTGVDPTLYNIFVPAPNHYNRAALMIRKQS